MTYLDDGVLFEILVRLPVKSLLRFKCVDRRWNSLISDPRFAKAQARMPMSNTSQRLLFSDKRGCISVGFEDLMNGRLEDSAMRLDGLDILCSCHGLMCLHHGFQRFVLYMTRRELPAQPFKFDIGWSKVFWGLGYDAINEDYKLVIGADTSECGWEFHVFSLRSNSWRRIGGLHIDDIQEWELGKYSNGFLHWLRVGGRGIVSFDIVTEQLHKGLLPIPVFSYPGTFTDLGVTECGWLVICRNSGNASEFWIMKDSSRGSNSTWTKLCYITDELKYHWSYLSWYPWVRNGKTILSAVLQGDRIGVYDPEEKRLKTIQVPKNHSPLYNFYPTIPHVLSLLPPHV